MLADVVQKANTQVHFDDFPLYRVADFVLTKGTGGTVIKATGTTVPATPTYGGIAGGWLNVPTAASTNDYQSISVVSKMVEFLAGLPVTVEARLMVTEAASNSSSWYFGVTDTLTTGLLSTVGVPASSFKGAVVYKSEGSANINFMVSNGSTQSTPIVIGTFVSGKPLLVTIVFDPGSGTTGYCTPQLNSQSDNALTPIRRQAFLLAGMAPMYLSAGIVASTSAAETLQLDYWGVEATRF